MDNPWANAWTTSESTTSDEPGWEQSTTANKPWTQPSISKEPTWNPPSPQWTANEPTWLPPTPQWPKPESETEFERTETEKEQEEEEEQSEWPKLSVAEEEDVQDVIVPASELPLQSPSPAIDTDAFGSFETAQWGHENDVSQREDEDKDPRPVDEWELARREKAKQDQFVPPELLSAILVQLELSKDLFPQNAPNYDTAPTTLARDILEGVEGLEMVADQLIPKSISLEPILPFPKSWIYKKTADAVRLSRHSTVARQASPLAKYLESKGSTAWEAAVKSRPEPIHDHSDVLPAGWKVLNSQKERGAAAPEMKRKTTSILSSFFGRNKTAPPATSTRASPTASPRHSIDLGKDPTSPTSVSTTSTAEHTPSTVKPTPAPVPTPSTLSTSAVMSMAESNSSPDIFPSEAPPPSAVSRLLGRFSRTQSSNPNAPSIALSSDDLDFLTEHNTFKVVPSALDDDDDDPLGFGSLQSEPAKQNLPPLAPPGLSTSTKSSSGKTSLLAPPVLPLGLPTPTTSSFELGVLDDTRTPTLLSFNSPYPGVTSKQTNGGKGFGWVPSTGSSNSGSTLARPSSSSLPTLNVTAGSTSAVPLLSPPSTAGKRPTPVAIMSSSPSKRPAPSPKLPPPPELGILPPPSGQVALLVAPRPGSQGNSPSQWLISSEARKAPGKSPEKNTLPPLPTESYPGASSSVDEDDDFSDFQDSSFTSFRSAPRSNLGSSPAYSHRFSQSISSASETSFFGGLGDSSMDSNMSMSVSGDDRDSMFSDFDDFVSGLTALPSTSATAKSLSRPLPNALVSNPSLSPAAPPGQQSAPQSQSFHQRTRSRVDSAKGTKSWPSTPSGASSPSPTLSRQNTGTTSFPAPVMSSGSSPTLSRQNTGNGNGLSSFPPVIMSTSRQNTGTFPSVIMSTVHNGRKTGTKASSGIPAILPGPPGFGPSLAVAKPSTPVAAMGIFGNNEGNASALPPVLSPPPTSNKAVSAENDDPLDLFGESMGTGMSQPVAVPALTPKTGKGSGGLSAQDLSFFEGL